MTEREYPRWVHRDGHPKDSVVVHSADEEQALVETWGVPVAPANALLGQSTRSPVHQVKAAAEAAPRKAGWPKGKPRLPKHVGMN